MQSGPKIVVIGGGTGSFMLLSGLKHYARDITALVNMADDGGSTGQLRDELGVLPPGDVRQCLVALSDEPIVRDLFNYRFDSGSLKGHAFGNLFLTALEKMTGSFRDAVEQASSVLNITGRVEPITLDHVELVMTFDDGRVVRGEFELGHMDFQGHLRPEVTLEPYARVNPAAEQAIRESDMVVIAPGNLYATLAPALVVGGVGRALRETTASLVYVCNLVTKPGQTDGFMVSDYTAEIERFVGAARLDYVIYNNQTPSQSLLERYAHAGELPVQWDDVVLCGQHYQAIGLSLVDDKMYLPSKDTDAIAHTRTLIRHDNDKLARQLMQICFMY